MAAAEKIRALGDNIFGYYHPISFNEFYKTVKQNGGSLFNDDFTEFTMDTPENIENLYDIQVEVLHHKDCICIIPQ